MWNEIKEDLITIPLKIKDKELEIYQKKKDIEEKLLVQKVMRDTVYLDVEKSRDKQGNKEFTNKELREAETTRRLANGQDYQKIKQEIDSLKDHIRSEEVNLEYIKRRYRTAEALTRM